MSQVPLKECIRWNQQDENILVLKFFQDNLQQVDHLLQNLAVGSFPCVNHVILIFNKEDSAAQVNLYFMYFTSALSKRPPHCKPLRRFLVTCFTLLPLSDFLSSNTCTHLEEVTVNSLVDHSAELSKCLNCLPSLEVLKLRVTSKSLALIKEQLTKRRLKSLGVGIVCPSSDAEQCLGNDLVSVVATTGGGASLAELMLHVGTNKGMRVLPVQDLLCTTPNLVELSVLGSSRGITFNYHGRDAVSALTSGACPLLQTLYLQDVKLSGSDLVCLVENGCPGGSLSQLKKLDLKSNGLTNIDVLSFASALKGQVQVFNDLNTMSLTGISRPSGVSHLAKVLYKVFFDKLEYLNMSSTNIEEEDYTALKVALQQQRACRALKTLNLRGNTFVSTSKVEELIRSVETTFRDVIPSVHYSKPVAVNPTTGAIQYTHAVLSSGLASGSVE